jgi:hypothetical protein
VLADGRELLSADFGHGIVWAALVGASGSDGARREDLIAEKANATRSCDSLMREWIARTHLLARLGLPARHARVGDVRLGELGVRHDHHHCDLSGVFHSGRGADLATGEATRLIARTTPSRSPSLRCWRHVLGALADYAPIKKRLLGLFAGIGCLAAGSLALTYRATGSSPRSCSGSGTSGLQRA